MSPLDLPSHLPRRVSLVGVTVILSGYSAASEVLEAMDLRTEIPAEDVEIMANGADVTDRFRPAKGGGRLVSLVEGLRVDPNTRLP